MPNTITELAKQLGVTPECAARLLLATLAELHIRFAAEFCDAPVENTTFNLR